MNAGALDVATSANQTLSGEISGAGALVKSGAGALTLTGSCALTSALDLPASDAVLDISGASGNRTIGGLAGAAGSQILLGGNTLTVAGIDPTPIFAGVISGAGGFTFGADGGLLAFSTQQAFTCPARVEAGTLELAATDTLANASSIVVGLATGPTATIDATLNGLDVVSGQTLGGYGTIRGNVTFLDGSILSPGGSVGTLTNDGSTTWNSGFTYLFEVNDASGTAGLSAGGWDLYNITDTLTLAAGPEFADQIVIDLTSLSGISPGFAASFDENANYAWLIADAGAEIDTFEATWFRVNTGNFLNLPGEPGRFSVVRGDQLAAGFSTGTSDQLYVVYAAIPEPGTLLLAGLLLAGLLLAGLGLAAARRRRRAARTTG